MASPENVQIGEQQSREWWEVDWWGLCDLLVLAALGLALFWGTSTQFSNRYNDMTRYQCYAIAFWQGQTVLESSGLLAGPDSQCAFLRNTPTTSLATKVEKLPVPGFVVHFLRTSSDGLAFHTLPEEYPFLALLPFSLPLLLPFLPYQVAFALLMIVIVTLLYTLLLYRQSRVSALVFALYLALGSWATATDRFDLVPAALVLGALLLAERSRWHWCFVLLALATLAKFYPLLLVLPCLIAQQRTAEIRTLSWKSWQRWSALYLFCGLCGLIMLLSLLCNTTDTLLPFGYFFGRPAQAESLPATLFWLGRQAGISAQYVFTYQSLNLISPLNRFISPLLLGLEVSGLIWVCWLQWKGRLQLCEAALLALLIMMVSGKVFSPQYLIWVTPLVALVGRANWKWLLIWGLICGLTTFMFPLHYNSLEEIDQFYPVIIVRDWLMLGLTCTLLVWYTRCRSVLKQINR